MLFIEPAAEKFSSPISSKIFLAHRKRQFASGKTVRKEERNGHPRSLCQNINKGMKKILPIARIPNNIELINDTLQITTY